MFSTRWQWPPRLSLLSPPQLIDACSRDRGTWSADDWKAYAGFLEDQGTMLVQELERLVNELVRERFKHTRRKVGAGIASWDLSSGLLGWPPRRKPGRKPGGRRTVEAEEVLALKAELESKSKKKMTDTAALREYYRLKGMGQYRARENRAILNAISKSRNRHKIRQTSPRVIL